MIRHLRSEARTNPRSLATHKTRHIKEGNVMRKVVLAMNTTLNGKVDDLFAGSTE